MSKLQSEGTQALLTSKGGSLGKYRRLMVGGGGIGAFIKYEMITSLFGSCPGALGLWFRKKFFRGLFRECGKNVIFGRNVTIRNPKRISLGSNIVIGDECVLDAKGAEGEGVIVRDGVFLSKGSIVTSADGTVEIDEGANIGSYCRIGTHGRTRIGKKALISSYCYVVGAGHESSRTDIPIMDQPNTTKGGATVGDGCWLGARVTVMDGVTIGNDSIIGAHAVVTKDVPPFSVALGIPAAVVKSRK